MTPRETVPTGGAPDLEALCDAARSVAIEDAAGRSIDWDSVQRRCRRRRTLRLAAASTLAVTLAAALGAWWLLAGPTAAPSGDAGTLRADRAAGAQPAGFRILRPADRIYVVAEASARLRTASAAELVLSSGVVWVDVDPSDGLLPFAVVTPDAAVRVAGTRFAVAFDPARGTRVAALEGHVVVQRGDRAVDVYGGTQLEPGAAEPVPLDPAWRLSLVDLLPPRPAPRAAPPAEPPAAAQADEAPPAAELPAEDVPAPEAPGTAAGDGDVAERWYREAESALGRGEFDRAIALLRRVADAAPRSTRAGHALIDLGRAALRAGRPAEAERAYERYLAQHPRGTLREDAWAAWCRLRARDGSPERVRACYAGYLAEFPAGAFAAEAREAIERTGAAAP